MGEARWFSNSKPTPSGVARQLVTFLVLPRKVTQRRRPRCAAPSGFPALLEQPGLRINSHDPLRGHVLKHMRRTAPGCPALLGGAQGKEKRKSKADAGQQAALHNQNNFTPAHSGFAITNGHHSVLNTNIRCNALCLVPHASWKHKRLLSENEKPGEVNLMFGKGPKNGKPGLFILHHSN